MILSILGVSALIIPVVLLVIYTSRLKSVPSAPSGDRQIDVKTIEDAVKKIPQPPAIISSPSPASPSASPISEGSPSAR